MGGFAPGYVHDRSQLVIADTQAEALERYREDPEEFGIPLPCSPDGQAGWIVPRRVGLVNEILAREAWAIIGQSTAPASPGSSKAKARLKAEDRKRIADQEAKKAEKRRQQAEKQAEAERLHQAQGTLLG